MRVWGRCFTGAVAAAASFILVSGPTAAQNAAFSAETADDLARFCQLDDKDFCYGFLNGAAQFYEALVTYERIDVEPFVCPGREVAREEAAGLFLAWLDANPAAGGDLAVDAVFRAWVEAFPCA